ncbi:hypothetical protein [Natrialba aegyptia]|uniref:hypothetical protein n=1 Tax=Natrialba aegyptia TaxID=129789 RepID=UPI0013759351|nr:hypothetical protein [Natrialba aegyptia]
MRKERKDDRQAAQAEVFVLFSCENRWKQHPTGTRRQVRMIRNRVPASPDEFG